MYGFTLRSSVYRAITGAIASIFAVVPSVSGRLLPCPEVWQGPSPDNTLAECNLFPWAARRFGPPLFIPFIFCVITLILLLFALIGRYCCRCCGSYRRRPTTVCCGGSEWDDRSAESKERMYSSSGVRCVKCSVFLVLVISVLALLLVAVGVYRTGITYGDVWEDADGVIVWASQQVSNILQTLTLANGALAGGLPPDLTTELNNQVNEIRITLDNIRVDTADRIWNPIAIAGYVIATVPFLFFFAALMFACCNVRTCGPLLVILLVWIVGILFCLLGLVFESVHYATDVACAEVRAQVAREPGVFQWYIIPRCNNLDLFTSARQQIAEAELTTSQSACEAMTSYCDASTTYVAPSTIFFTCPYATTFTTACTTADQANRLITMETVVKTSGPITNLCASVPNSQCTVLLCATDCVDSDLRSQMALVVQRLDEAVRLQTAVQVNIVPLLDCNTIVDQAVAILNECPALMRNSAIIAAGCYVYVLSALCIIILLFLGQKRFFNPDNALSGEEDEYAMDRPGPGPIDEDKDIIEDPVKHSTPEKP